MPKSATIGSYLVQRLEEAGLKHVFGIPGDYVLSFYDLLEASSMDVVGTCAEIGAGYAADAYARVNGLGAVCITYCVGGLNVLNAIAGAYAEKSPVIVISGAPGMDERSRSPLLHHQVRNFDTQLEIYRQVTAASFALEDPARAPGMIDQAIATCIREKRPVYLEIPRDLVNAKCAPCQKIEPQKAVSNRESLAEAVAEAVAMLKSAKKPVILAGVEVHRHALQPSVIKLVERTGFPVAATLLGKSVITERHPQYVGVYEGAMGREEPQRIVERSDCVLILGAFMTDINLGIYTAKLDPGRTIYAHSQRISIKHHHYDNIFLGHFISELAKADLGPRRKFSPTCITRKKPYKPRDKQAITVARLFDRMNEFLADDTIVICDIGDSLFGASDLTIHKRTEFVSPAYYTSMGFAVPAAVGTQIRDRNLRPIVFVGDGAFQMTGHELGSVARHGLNPIVFVLNNKGYTTERFIHEGNYNDIPNWAYHLWPQIVGQGWGCEVRTEGELEVALSTAKANQSSFSIINVHLDPMDCSAALVRLGKRLGKKVK